MGIWTSTDPKDQDWNPYSYCGLNPINRIDPNGEFWNVLGSIIGAAAGAYLGGAISNGSLNPGKWDWDNPNTLMGVFSGALSGGMMGYGIGSKIDASLMAKTMNSPLGRNIMRNVGGVAGANGNTLSPYEPLAAQGDLVYFSKKPGSKFPYHVGFDKGNNQIIMLTGGKVSTVDLNAYLQATGYGVVGYADIKGIISPDDFVLNILDQKTILEANFANWDPSGTMCVDVMNAGFGSKLPSLKMNINADYLLNPTTYTTSPNNSYFFRRNTTFKSYFMNQNLFSTP